MQQNKSATVRRYFNTIAGRYDFMNTLLSFGLHFLWKKETLKKAGLKGAEKVLDLCGGTGDLAMLAAPMVGKSGHIVLYDFSPEMIREGRHKINKAAARIYPICGDAENIAIRDNTFDRVFIGFGLRNLSDMEKGLREIFRVLKPSGKLLCLEFSQPVSPVMRILYNLYSFTIIPMAGKIIAGSTEAYKYLPQSIRAFPLPEKLSEIMGHTGFSEVSYKRLTNGIAVIHVATKS